MPKALAQWVHQLGPGAWGHTSFAELQHNLLYKFDHSSINGLFVTSLRYSPSRLSLHVVLLVNNGGITKISSMLLTGSCNMSAYTLSIVCFYGGCLAQTTVQKKTVERLLEMAEGVGSSLDARCHAVQALGILCLETAVHLGTYFQSSSVMCGEVCEIYFSVG